MASNTPAFDTLIASLVVWNSFAISGMAGKRQVLENVAASVIQLTMNKITHLRQFGSAATQTASLGSLPVDKHSSILTRTQLYWLGKGNVVNKIISCEER